MVNSGYVNVRDFGAIGDGTTNDTDAIQEAINYAASFAGPAAGNRIVYFPRGTYMIVNLILPKPTDHNPWMRGDGYNQTTIKAIPQADAAFTAASGDDSYLIAPETWLEAGNAGANYPIGIEKMSIDADGERERALVLRNYFSTVDLCYIFGATINDLEISSDASDGTALGSTLVNNTISNCWIGYSQGTSTVNIKINDSGAKCTDYHIINNFISGGDYGLQATTTTAGYNISGNHFYSNSTYNIDIAKGNLGTRVTGNYFEEHVQISGTGAGYEDCTIGPANFYKGNVDTAHVAGKTITGKDRIIFVGDTFAGTVKHTYFSADRALTFKQCHFRNNDPFQAHNSGSPGVFEIIDCTQTGRVGPWSGTGKRTNFASSAEPPRPVYNNNSELLSQLTGAAVFEIYNGTAPAASVTDGIQLYAEDVSSSSELKVRDEAGNVTTLSPHNFSLIDAGPSEEMAFAYFSMKDTNVSEIDVDDDTKRVTKTVKKINVDMLKAIRLLEGLTGETLVHTGEEDVTLDLPKD
jgi:hypothetical protein